MQHSSAKSRKIKNKKLYYQYLLEHCCVDCGEPDPIVLQFDHVRGKKIKKVSTMIKTYAWQAVLEEIEKCDVVCANCHSKRTAKQQKWYAFLDM